MKKTCGYKSLDGKIYEKKYDCVEADNLYRARQLRKSVENLRHQIQNIIHYNDRVIGNIMSYGDNPEKDRETVKLLQQIDSKYLTEVLCDLALTSLPELKLLDKEIKRTKKKAMSLEQTRTHIIDYLTKALWH